MSPSLNIGILAAGRSSRMGGVDKLMQEVDGVPLLRRAVDRAVAAETGLVFVAVPDLGHDRAKVLGGTKATLVAVPDAKDGMGRSMAALAAASDGTPLMLAFADMPDITDADFRSIGAAFLEADCQKIVRAVAPNGTAGHPIAFPVRFFEELRSLRGDEGPKALLRREGAVGVTIHGATTDLDTPEDWAAWQTQRNGD